MATAILDDVKKAIGLMPEYDAFDQTLILHINSVFMILTQMGVGPDTGFQIVDGTETWDEFIPEDCVNYKAVKSYVVMKVRMLFDPPSNSVHMNALNESIKEFEWRLNLEAESRMD